MARVSEPPTNVAWVQPGLIRRLSMLLFSPCSEGLSPGTPDFLPHEKPTSPRSNTPWIEDPHENQVGLMWLPL